MFSVCDAEDGGTCEFSPRNETWVSQSFVLYRESKAGLDSQVLWSVSFEMLPLSSAGKETFGEGARCLASLGAA